MPEKLIHVLVFPCGSEVGLEIHRSLKFSKDICVFGGSSVDDHGKFVFERYFGDIPFISDPSVISVLHQKVCDYQIDLIYPAMDSVAALLKEKEKEIGCTVVSAEKETVNICLSKRKTYEALRGLVRVPEIFESAESITNFPVFLKPETGYGTRGTQTAHQPDEVAVHMRKVPDCLILEYLPGREYTVDCFTNRKGQLLFVGPRERKRISNGISVNTVTLKDHYGQFQIWAQKISNALKIRGAWFFQVRENIEKEWVLLEVSARLGGSSGVYRCQGINFALLSVYDALGIDVSIFSNELEIELDRALENRYQCIFEFNRAYIDFDDTLIIDDKVNTTLLSLLFQFINQKKEIILLTRHAKDIHETLARFRLTHLFDEIIHLGKLEKKSGSIRPASAILIDDSFRERTEVAKQLKIPVFAPDAIECLFR